MSAAVSVLQLEIDELKNAVTHLLRSNAELREALASDADPEFRDAVNENLVTIARKRARVAALEEELRRLTGREGPGEEAGPGAGGHTMEPEGVPLPEEGAEGGAAGGVQGGAGAGTEGGVQGAGGPGGAAGGAAGAGGEAMEVDGRGQAGAESGTGAEAGAEGGVWL
ncbi:hypothetical protein HYH03_006271 [Edaphochlamys debaryana]|uniref:Uncharacterized protein n=1 Tax=Edaphochlamys debaryana TaxID=47281 RepID=A0A836C0C1_9CHLO|nr:hypothetical protein HYH03_006271 [Edaphochlamys debaryana]|eukprot:KAG2495671.1 hypothetical protein HYH03_006271 [Edaphochlamys debaryana]